VNDEGRQKEGDMAEYTPVQKVRWEARNLGRAARNALNGVVGLPKDEQIERLKLAKEAYGEAIKVVNEGLAVLYGRDEAEYQATKHQGAEGWFAHMVNEHGADPEKLEGFGAFFLAAPDPKAEAAYQLHRNPEAAAENGFEVVHADA
jgi:hypothetical protein